MSITLDRRAAAYAAGEAERFKKHVSAFVGKVLAASQRAGARAELDKEVAAFMEHELAPLVSSAFLVGHAAGFVDKDRPNWLWKR